MSWRNFQKTEVRQHRVVIDEIDQRFRFLEGYLALGSDKIPQTQVLYNLKNSVELAKKFHHYQLEYCGTILANLYCKRFRIGLLCFKKFFR
jgi:hypothetical protein